MAFISSIISGGASLIGAGMQSNAAQNAAQLQAQSAAQAQAIQQQEFNTQQANQQPWLQAGGQALSQMSNPYFQQSFTPGDLTQDPGYQFRMNQGTAAIQASAAANGGLMSGNTMKALNDYGQQSASQEYQNAYNRFNNDQSQQFGRLSTIAGLGQNSTNNLGQMGQQYAQNMGNIITQNGNNQGASQIAQGNSWANSISGIGSSIGNNMNIRSLLNQPPPPQFSPSGGQSMAGDPGGGMSSLSSLAYA